MAGPEYLVGDRLSLHIVESEDHEFIQRHWVDTRHQPETIVRYKTKEDIKGWVSDDDAYHFVVCQDGDRVGHAFLQDIDKGSRRGELGYLIAGDHQGKGYATEAGDLILTHAFDEMGLHKVWARVLGYHEASKRVLEKLGFKEEGVIRDKVYSAGEYLDVYRYGLLESER